MLEGLSLNPGLLLLAVAESRPAAPGPASGQKPVDPRALHPGSRGAALGSVSVGCARTGVPS